MIASLIMRDDQAVGSDMPFGTKMSGVEAERSSG
jgi:hypothetical protein